MYITANLTARQAGFINQLVREGVYLNPTDAMRDALRMWLSGDFKPPKYQLTEIPGEGQDITTKIHLFVSDTLGQKIKAAARDEGYATVPEVLRAAINTLMNEMLPKEKPTKAAEKHGFNTHPSAKTIQEFRDAAARYKQKKEEQEKERAAQEAERLRRMGLTPDTPKPANNITVMANVGTTDTP